MTYISVGNLAYIIRSNLTKESLFGIGSLLIENDKIINIDIKVFRKQQDIE